MQAHTQEQGPEFPVGSMVTLAKEQHPKAIQSGDSEVTATWFCTKRNCWMHTVKFACDRHKVSFPPLWLKFAKEQP